MQFQMRAEQEKQIVWLILALSAALGLLQAWVTPAWVNVDETGHFEVVRSIAEHRRLPDPASPDPSIFERIQASLVWATPSAGAAGRMANARLAAELGLTSADDWAALRGRLEQQPGYNLLADVVPSNQLAEAPGYYVLAALTQLPLQRAPIEIQLFAARLASVALGVLTVWLAARAAAELFPDSIEKRLAAPALLALLPSFVVLQGAVHNTIAAAAALTLTLYAALRLVRRGLSAAGIALLAAGAAACLLSKSTAYFGLLVALLAVPLARREAWPRRTIYGPAALGVIAALAVLVIQWPAGWHPPGNAAPRTGDAPLGSRAIRLEGQQASLWQVLPPATVREIRGQTVTLGVWLRSPGGPQEAAFPALWALPDRGRFNEHPPLIDNRLQVGPEWQFAARTVTIPQDAQCVFIWLRPEAGGAVQVDGVVLAPGSHPAAEPPEFRGRLARRGTWGGIAFQNLITNGSAERGQLLLRPGIEQRIPAQLADTRVNANRRLASLQDLRGNGEILITGARWLFTSFWARYAWSLPGLTPGMAAFLGILTGISGVGLVVCGLRTAPGLPLWQRRALALTLAAALLVVGAALVRIDPMRIPFYCDQYQGRFVSTGYYVIPGAVPLLLLWYVGLAAWGPRRYQRWLLAAAMLGLFFLTAGGLLGQQLPTYLASYGLPVHPTLFTSLWGVTP